MSAASYVGTVLPQFGPLVGAKLFVDGVEVTPDAMTQTPPRRIGRNGRGRPFYQGAYSFTATWVEMTLDEYQRLTTIFYPKLGSEAGTLVALILPWIDQAGRFVEGDAYMEWPDAGIGVLVERVSVTFSDFKLLGDRV